MRIAQSRADQAPSALDHSSHEDLRPYALLRENVAEHLILLLVGSPHAPLDALCATSLQDFRLFQQPARSLSNQLLIKPDQRYRKNHGPFRLRRDRAKHESALTGPVIADVEGGRSNIRSPFEAQTDRLRRRVQMTARRERSSSSIGNK
jgi:hypothetical protein